MKQILLVEDDPTLGVTLKERLSREGYEIQWAASAHEAREALRSSQNWDLVIFDVGLPDGSGFELARAYRPRAPFLFVTALSDAEHRLQGFDLGAEEYIPKPFHLRELLLRVKHVLENHAHPKRISTGGLNLDIEAMTVTLSDGSVIRPAPKDFQLLALLMERAPKVISRDEMLDTIWGSEHIGNQRTVDNAIMRLRSLFPGSPIRSVRGVGYQWLGDE